MDRQGALAAGFSVSELDRLIGSTLQPLMALLGPGVITILQAILGDLLPAIPQPPASGGGGGILAGGTGETGGTGEGSQPPDDGTGGGGDGGGQPGEGEGGGGGQGGPLFPGNGNHNGWRNKPPAGGWKGENPKRNGPKDDHREQGKQKGQKK
jgi:hypothetical protein